MSLISFLTSMAGIGALFARHRSVVGQNVSPNCRRFRQLTLHLNRTPFLKRNVDELFLISFVGEFNSGKSSLVNKLLGNNLAEVGATPTTAKATVFQDVDSVKWTDDPELSKVADDTGHAVAPVIRAVDGIPWLRNVRIVDTPGMNAIMREHARLTLDFLPRSDLVVFLTSADRPFTESERRFLLNIKEWGKKLLFVVTKIE